MLSCGLQMTSNDYLITSEIHPFIERVNAEPIVNSQNVVSRFSFNYPSEFQSIRQNEPSQDEDGDYIIIRKHGQRNLEGSILIEHSISTTLSLVGQQIWRGSLLLADFLLHNGSILKEKIAVELGSGTGLAGIISALFCSEVICTDLDTGNILELIQANANRNLCTMGIKAGKIHVEELDFLKKEWNKSLKEKLSNISIVLAADVIYDNDLTEAFVDTLNRLLVGYKSKRVAYLAMEKRYVFTLADLDSVAPCYEHFLLCLQKSPLWPHATCLPIDFPQYFNYERGKDLVLWEIRSV